MKMNIPDDENFTRPRHTTVVWDSYWAWLVANQIDLETDPRTIRERVTSYLIVND
jgi:hypothetical protein